MEPATWLEIVGITKNISFISVCSGALSINTIFIVKKLSTR